MRSILVVSNNETAYGAIYNCFHVEYKVDKASSREAALDFLHRKRCDFMFIDAGILKGKDPDESYKSTLQDFWHIYPTLEIIVTAPQEQIREAVAAVKAGASNYITYPINPEELKYVTESIRESILFQSELDYLRDRFWQADSLEIVQTKSPIMKKVFDQIRSVAPTKSMVLLIGETGTGKGVLARLIHRHSNRRDAQFIAVHCGAIPDTLLESELFGHEKGSFTGAIRRKLGKFEIAHGGTIFLDEIGTITHPAQIKLLQVLQDGTFQHVGGEDTIQANVRVIAATNTDLKKMCEQGQFRRDLYYRLNVFPIEIPPLRERVDDIPLLVEVFLKKLNGYYPKEIHDVHPQVVDALKRYTWPGNIRELENLMERAYILETSPVLTAMSFPGELFESAASEGPSIDSFLSLAEVRRRGVEAVEKGYINEVLTRYRGRIKDSADAAGISTRQLHKLMKKYGVRKESFKAPNESRRHDST